MTIKKTLFTAVILIIFFLLNPNKSFGANLINASGTTSNANFLLSNIIKLQFTTITDIPSNGSILVTLPSAPAGFNINRINSSDISVSSLRCTNSWTVNNPVLSSPTSTIRINRNLINCPPGSLITIMIGNQTNQIINPKPSLSHQIGKADIYGINIKTLDGSDEIIDEIIVKVAIIEAVSNKLNVSVTVGKYAFVLFGYTSPKAQVIIDGVNLSSKTTANEKGYFQFPLVQALSSQEICLIAVDQLGRVSSPVCLPPFPTNYTANIGPVLISPTLSLNQSNYFIGDQVNLSGQTMPNTSVDISFFTDEKRTLEEFLSNIDLIKPAYAFTFPKITTKADEKGNFSISLPSSYAQFFRMFAQSNYLNELSPKSNLLQLKILPLWFIIVGIFGLLWSLLKSNIISLLILTEFVGISIFIIRRYLHPIAIVKNRALAVREKEAIALREKFDLLLEEHELVKNDNLELVET